MGKPAGRHSGGLDQGRGSCGVVRRMKLPELIRRLSQQVLVRDWLWWEGTGGSEHDGGITLGDISAG